MPDAVDVLDIGSDSDNYRKTVQKYINDLFEKMTQQGIKITTLDLDPHSGADIIHDITEPLAVSGNFDVVILSNVLEHIEENKISSTINNLFGLLEKGGLLIITVPYNLPKHDRPIDNLLRPTPEELVKLVNRPCLVAEQWEDQHYREPFISQQSLAPRPVVTGAVFCK